MFHRRQSAKCPKLCVKNEEFQAAIRTVPTKLMCIEILDDKPDRAGRLILSIFTDASITQ